MSQREGRVVDTRKRKDMKLKSAALAAVAAGTLTLVGCGTPNNAAGPPAQAPSGSSSAQAPSAAPTTQPSANRNPGSGNGKGRPGGPSSGHSTSAGRHKKSPHGTSNTGGQRIDPQADENAQPSKSGEQTAVLNRVPGKKADTCAVVGSQRDLRSGDFLAGPFDTARAQYGHREPGATKRSVRLYFVPLHAKAMPGLKLTFTNVASGATVVARQKQVADAEQWKFYDTRTLLKESGRWQVRATAGPDKGCFTFALPKV